MPREHNRIDWSKVIDYVDAFFKEDWSFLFAVVDCSEYRSDMTSGGALILMMMLVINFAL